MILQRHYLLEISDYGRKFAFELIKKNNPADKERIEQIIIKGFNEVKIPGIVRREEGEAFSETVPVGFVSPYKINGNRLRVPAFVPISEIEKIISPFQVINNDYIKRNNAMRALEMTEKISSELGIKLGVWGSTALEILTGLPYTTSNSDIDLLIAVNDYDVLKSFFIKANEACSKLDVKVDIELELPNGYGVKFAELFLDTDMVLGKGLNDIKLISKKKVKQILNWL